MTWQVFTHQSGIACWSCKQMIGHRYLDKENVPGLLLPDRVRAVGFCADETLGSRDLAGLIRRSCCDRSEHVPSVCRRHYEGENLPGLLDYDTILTARE